METRPGHGDGEARALLAEVKSHGAILGGFVGLLWLIQIVNAFVFGGSLVGLGIVPRTLAGLWGILFAPFLHGSFAHLIANTVPLAVLGWFVMLRRKRDLLTVSLLAGLVGGLGTWLIAPAASVTVGASILIFGYLGYLLSRGIFERRFWPIVGSLIVFFLYGGALFGVLPGAIGISWQGHLFGLLGGVLAARMLRTPDAVAEPRPERRRIAVSGGARIAEAPGLRPGLRSAVPSSAPDPAAASDADAELDAELERARARLHASRSP